MSGPMRGCMHVRRCGRVCKTRWGFVLWMGVHKGVSVHAGEGVCMWAHGVGTRELITTHKHKDCACMCARLCVHRCPITLSMMQEPAQASSGVTYEKSAIFQWLSVHRVDPVTQVRAPS